MAPEPIRRADAERWSADYLAVLDRAKEAVTAYFDHFSPETQEIARLYLRCSPGLTKRNQGFYELIGSSKIRVHGDYHLGQTLRTIDDEFVVIDFEGEPQRTIEERRRKTSPLKDVAGMLRSFSYSRGTASTWITPESALTAADLAIWEREMRRAFLAGYELTARGSGASFLPESKEDFHEALAAWELDKAAYEVLYEINNRPNWLWIPLSGMLKWCEPRQ
jgi:maltose alpha-D-glucosyltransferase/alpha-amylase